MSEDPQPPVGMVMPHTAEQIATISLWAVSILLFVASLVWWWRSRSPIYFLGMIGGLLAAGVEVIADVLVQCYHFEVGQQYTAYSTFGRHIPWWAVGCYPVYIGGLSLLIYTLFRRGVTYRGYWLGVGAVIAGNLAFEWPILSAHMYVYYGDQPFTVAGFPVVVGVNNALGVVVGALVLALYTRRFPSGKALLLIPLLPSLTMLGVYGAIIPHMLTLHSNASMGVKYVGTTLGLIICLVGIDAVGRFAVKSFPAPRAHRTAADTHGERVRVCSAKVAGQS